MSTQNTIPENEIGADGRIRRKYELEDEVVPQKGMRFAVGLLIANAIGLIKSLFFDAEKAAAKAGGNGAGEAGSAPPGDTFRIPDLKLVSSREPGQEDALDPAGANAGSAAGSASQGSGRGLPLAETPPADAATSPGSRAPQILTTATPAPRAIQPPANANDRVATSQPSSSGSGGSGGGGVGGTSRQSRTNGDEREASNRAPTVAAPVALPGLFLNTSVIIAMSDLLRGAADLDGDDLTVQNLTASSGEIVAQANGTWHYTPEPGDAGDVLFSYEIVDASGATAAQIALLDIVSRSGEDFIGTSDADLIEGSAGDDRIAGDAGADEIFAGSGDDIVDGGDGADRIEGGAGDDVIYAGAGNDSVFGGDGNDLIFGGTGDDLLSGGAGNDTLTGDDGADTLDGGDDDDVVFGSAGADVVRGNDGNDLLDGGSGSDQLEGGDGDDFLIGGEGDDALDGGSGDDVFFATPDDGDDVIAGGEGADTYNLAGTNAAAMVDLDEGTAASDDIGDDIISSIENVTGGSGDDDITGDDGANELEGAGGDDRIEAGGGDDILTGGAGEDLLDGGSGDDEFVATPDDGDDDIAGGEGADSYNLGATGAAAAVNLAEGTATSDDIGTDTISSIENVTGGSGDDDITGDDGANELDGGDGNDRIEAGSGDDAVDGGDGDDWIEAGSGDDVVDGGDGNDVIVASEGDGNDAYDGGEGHDTYDMSGMQADATVDLGQGRASSAETGEDTITGFESVIGGAGDDDIVGDDLDNAIDGSGGDDRLEGAAGDDTVYGGEGDDVFVATASDTGSESHHCEDDGDDYYSGGSGDDTYDLSGTSADAVIDLVEGTATSDEIGEDDLSGIENVVGGSGNDTIIADENENVLQGGEGFDVFVFLEGNSSGHGGHNRDRIEDFEVGDKIDVAGFDGDGDQEGFQRLTFVYDQANFDGVGQVLFRYEDQESGTVTLLRFNIERDDADDVDEWEFEIEIVGRHELTDENLIT